MANNAGSLLTDYQLYLGSPEWATKQEERLRFDDYRCTCCGQEEFLNIHHRTYVRLFRERLEDLMTLCDDCHRERHGLTPNDRFEQFRREQKRYRQVFVGRHGPFPHTCFFCGKEIDGHTVPCDSRAAVVHHIDDKPWHNEPSNLAPAHWGCHSRYHNKGRKMSPTQRRLLIDSNSTPEKRASFSRAATRRWKDPAKRAEVLAAQKDGRPTASCVRCKKEVEGGANIARHALACRGEATASNDTRRRIGDAQRGSKNKWYGTKGPMGGKRHKPETRAKMSATQKARHAAKGGQTATTRAKIGTANAKSLKGRKQSPETVAKRTATMRAKWQDPAFRAAHLAGLRAASPQIAAAARNRPALVCDRCGKEVRGGKGNLSQHQASARCARPTA